MEQTQDIHISKLKERITTLQTQSKLSQNGRQSLFRELSHEIKFLMDKFTQLNRKTQENIQVRNSAEKSEFQKIIDENRKCKALIKNQDQLIAKYQREIKQRQQQFKQIQQKVNQRRKQLWQKQIELNEKDRLFKSIQQGLRMRQKIINDAEKNLQTKESHLNSVMQSLVREAQQTKSEFDKSLPLCDESSHSNESALFFEGRSQKKEAQLIKFRASSSTQKFNQGESTFQQSVTQFIENENIFKQTVQTLNFTDKDLDYHKEKIESLQKMLIDTNEKYRLQLQAQIQQNSQQIKKINQQNALQIEKLIQKYQIQIQVLKKEYKGQIQKIKLQYLIQQRNEEDQSTSLTQLQKQTEAPQIKEKINSIQITHYQILLENQLKSQKQLKNVILNYQNKLKDAQTKYIELQNAFKKIQTMNKSLQQKNATLISELQKCKKMHQETNSIANRRLLFLEKQLQDNRKANLQYKNHLSNLSEMLESLKRQMQQKDIKLQSLERQLQRTKNYNQILLSDNKSLKNNVKMLNERIKEMEDNSHDFKKKLITSSNGVNKTKLQTRSFSKSNYQPFLSPNKSIAYLSREEKQKEDLDLYRKDTQKCLTEKRKYSFDKEEFKSKFTFLPIPKVLKKDQEKPIIPSPRQSQKKFLFLSSLDTTFSPNALIDQQLIENTTQDFLAQNSLSICIPQQNPTDQIKNLHQSNYSDILALQNLDRNSEQFLNNLKQITFRNVSRQSNRYFQEINNYEAQSDTEINNVTNEFKKCQQNFEFSFKSEKTNKDFEINLILPKMNGSLKSPKKHIQQENSIVSIFSSKDINLLNDSFQ